MRTVTVTVKVDGVERSTSTAQVEAWAVDNTVASMLVQLEDPDYEDALQRLLEAGGEA